MKHENCLDTRNGSLVSFIYLFIIYINSLRLSLTGLGFVRLTGPGLAFPAGQSPAVGGAGPGLSQKADRARPGTPTVVTEPGVTLVWTDRAWPDTPGRSVARRGGCRAGSVIEGRSGPARYPPRL